MGTVELLEQIKRLTNSERLEIIKATAALVRNDADTDIETRRERMRAAALEAKELYEPGGELTEWTVLDGEEVLDDSAAKG